MYSMTGYAFNEVVTENYTVSVESISLGENVKKDMKKYGC